MKFDIYMVPGISLVSLAFLGLTLEVLLFGVSPSP